MGKQRHRRSGPFLGCGVWHISGVGQGQRGLMGEEMSTSDLGVLSVHEWSYGDIPDAGIYTRGDGRVWTLARAVSCLSPQDRAFLQVSSWLVAYER